MTNTITPATLAEEIGVDAKSLRGYLRKNHTRTPDVKGTGWIITPEAAQAAREHFEKQRTPEAPDEA